MYRKEDYLDYYNEYFKEFNRLAVGSFADLSYGNDQPNDTASSLESLIAYANYINEGNGNILNAGAGVSSWIFRKLFREVVCIDTNNHYLDLISLICGFSKLNLQFDHVYYDYGTIERLPYLGSAIDIARKSIYVDDVDSREQCLPYRETVIKLCEAMKLKWFDLPGSKDEHGRSGIVIEK